MPRFINDVYFKYFKCAILSIKSSDYGSIIGGISKSKAVNLLKNADLTKKVEHYKT